jgi:hypothetical protein
MDARAKQRLVGIDVAQAGDKPLVEQQRLDASRPPAQPRCELSRRQRKNVGAKRRNIAPPDASEAADVVVEQKPVAEAETSARVGARLALEPERARHAEPRHHARGLEIEDHALAVTPDALQRSRGLQRAAREFAVEHARDRLGLRQFRHYTGL